MFINFDSVFKKTKEEKIKEYSFINRILKKSLKDKCNTCKYRVIEEVYSIGGTKDYIDYCSIYEDMQTKNSCKLYLFDKKKKDEINKRINFIEKRITFLEKL